jgi:hypothetical protein
MPACVSFYLGCGQHDRPIKLTFFKHEPDDLSKSCLCQYYLFFSSVTNRDAARLYHQVTDMAGGSMRGDSASVPTPLPGLIAAYVPASFFLDSHGQLWQSYCPW